jgi:hypothetical protein
MPTLKVEAYLTEKAAAVFPSSVIVRVEDENVLRFILQRPGYKDLELGGEFGEASRALYAAIRDHQAGRKLPG